MSFIRIKIPQTEMNLAMLNEKTSRIAKIVKIIMNYSIVTILDHSIDCSLRFLGKINTKQTNEFIENEVQIENIIYSFSLKIETQNSEDFLKDFIKMIYESLVPAISGIYVIFVYLFYFNEKNRFLLRVLRKMNI